MIARFALAFALSIAAMAPTAVCAQTAAPSSIHSDPVRDRVREIMRDLYRTCWRAPEEWNDNSDVDITVQFELNEDGSLDGGPRIIEPQHYLFNPALNEAAEAAVTAVRACAPYPFASDPITAGHYDAWREVETSFRAWPSPASR